MYYEAENTLNRYHQSPNMWWRIAMLDLQRRISPAQVLILHQMEAPGTLSWVATACHKKH